MSCDPATGRRVAVWVFANASWPAKSCPGLVKHEAEDDPEDADRQLTGPAGFLATCSWLRNSFSQSRFEHRETTVDGLTVTGPTDSPPLIPCRTSLSGELRCGRSVCNESLV